MTQNKHQRTTDNMATLLELVGVSAGPLWSVVDNLPLYVWIHDELNEIVYGNRQFNETFRACSASRKCYRCLMGRDEPCNCCLSGSAHADNAATRCRLCKRKNAGYDLNTVHTPITGKDGQRYTLKSSFHIQDLGRLTDKPEQEQDGGQDEQIYLVLCSSCSKVRDRNNNWLSVDTRIIDYFNVHLSHGICPECTARLYPGLKLRSASQVYKTR